MRVCIAVLLALCLPAIVNAAPPPITAFTNFAKYEAMKISPDGKYLAYTHHEVEHEVMTVLNYPELRVSAQVHFGDQTDVASFEWANESRLLIQPSRRFPGYSSFKIPTGELLGLDADGKGAVLLFGYRAGDQDAVLARQRQSTLAGAYVLGRLPENPAEVLIQTFGYRGYGVEGAFNAVYRMNVQHGKLAKLATAPVRNATFLTDIDRRVALASGNDLEGDNQVFFRAAGGDEWKLVAHSARDAGSIWPVATSGRKGEFYALDDRDASTRGVFVWTPESGEQRLVFRHPGVDVGLEGVDPDGKPWGFSYVDHFPGYWYPDPEHPIAQIHNWLYRTFRDDEVEITSQTDDMSLVVARISGPRMPPTYFVMDVKARKALHQLPSRPDLRPEDLAAVEPIEFTARDGIKIRGYLTTPNVHDAKRLPMIVLVHGGPHGVFDRYEFDYEAQLLASRGYAVLQVNYRGSGGRGREFESSGYGRWGREMQDDITDGVRWAIGDGAADPKRICIYGASYGAYAALMGVIREPDLFRCAVGMAGVYDLPLMFEKGDIQSVERGMNYLKMAVGTDIDDLKRRSPVYNADKIRAAVLLLHGKVDQRAPFEHAKRMREALEKAGNAPEWSTEWGEGHGFFDKANRARAYALILEFFAKHLDTSEAGVNAATPWSQELTTAVAAGSAATTARSSHGADGTFLDDRASLPTIAP
jgi:dipeptidyl aminopeptidase/acylaminoacyl peptidase